MSQIVGNPFNFEVMAAYVRLGQPIEYSSLSVYQNNGHDVPFFIPSVMLMVAGTTTLRPAALATADESGSVHLVTPIFQ